MKHSRKWAGKRVRKWAGKRTAVLIFVAGTFVGCEPPPVKPKPVPVPPPAPMTRTEMTRALAQEDADFGNDVARLPGISAEDHREALVMLLDRLPRILKLINGDDESPGYKNRVAVIKAARATVSSEGVERRRMEAVENQALQAVAPALAELAARYLYDDTELTGMLENLNVANSVAAGSVGPMHDLDATNAFVNAQAVIDRMTYDLVERFLPEAAPPADQTVTPPATPDQSAVTPPAPAPAIAPTTDATTAPSTAPAADATTAPATPTTAPTTSP
jgi:hypothetical protein